MKKNYSYKIGSILISFFIILILLKKIIDLQFFTDENLFLFQGLFKTLLALIVVYLIKKAGLFDIKLFFKNNLISLLLCCLILYLSFKHTFNQIESLKINVSMFEHYTYFYQCIATGVFEELLCRVLIFGYVCVGLEKTSEKNYYKQAILTSFLFAIMHLTNLFNNEMDLISVVNQVIFAFIIGLFLQSVFVKSKNIILVSVIHGVINYNGMINSKLFKINNNSIGSNQLSDFLDSLITFSVGVVILFPFFYFFLLFLIHNQLLKQLLKMGKFF